MHDSSSPGPARTRPLWPWITALLVGSAVAAFASSTFSTQLFLLFFRGLFRHGWNFNVTILMNDRYSVEKPGMIQEGVSMSTGPEPLLEQLGEPFFRLFMGVDDNKDGYLNPKEFVGIYRLLSPIEIPMKKNKMQSMVTESTNTVVLKTHFQPLLLNSTTKRLEEKFLPNRDYFEGFLKWMRPHRQSSKLSVKDLTTLLWPPAARKLPVGSSYDIIVEGPKFGKELRAFPMTSNRYYLPTNFGSRAEELLSVLMSAFHPRAFPRTRYQPVGSAGVVRALSEDLVEVAFRIHAEFQLNEPPNYPFWFTPSYFFGRAIFTKNLTDVLDFELSSPSERALNVDMEWLQTSNARGPLSISVEVDIGYVPEMRLSLNSAPKAKAQSWKENITMTKAFVAVERHLYPFKKIEYAPFGEAFQLAKKESKLVHSVILWGSLDDQSC